MPNPTPDPTDEEVDAGIRLAHPGLWAAWDELLRRLRVNLPAQIARKNAEYDFDPEHGIQVPRGYYRAPATPTSVYSNTICVRLRAGHRARAARTFETISQVEIFSIEDSVRISEQVRTEEMRVALIYGVLHKYLAGCFNLQGQRVWNELLPGDVTDLPDEPSEWQKYSGFVAGFTLIQRPDCGPFTPQAVWEFE